MKVPSRSVPNEIYGRVSCVYDILNHMLLDAQLAPFHNGERLLASTSIEKVENWSLNLEACK